MKLNPRFRRAKLLDSLRKALESIEDDSGAREKNRSQNRRSCGFVDECGRHQRKIGKKGFVEQGKNRFDSE